MRVGIDFLAAIQWCPLGLVLEEAHRLDVLLQDHISIFNHAEYAKYSHSPHRS